MTTTEKRDSWSSGESKSQLTWADVKYIRTSDETVTNLAIKYKVTRKTIYDILHMKIWKPSTRDKDFGQ